MSHQAIPARFYSASVMIEPGKQHQKRSDGMYVGSPMSIFFNTALFTNSETMPVPEW